MFFLPPVSGLKRKHQLELGNTLHEAKKNQGQIDQLFLKIRCVFMMELQSRGPLTATLSLFTPRWILVVGSPEFTESLIKLVQVRVGRGWVVEYQNTRNKPSNIPKNVLKIV